MWTARPLRQLVYVMLAVSAVAVAVTAWRMLRGGSVLIGAAIINIALMVTNSLTLAKLWGMP
jgi:hypothetical protein